MWCPLHDPCRAHYITHVVPTTYPLWWARHLLCRGLVAGLGAATFYLCQDKGGGDKEPRLFGQEQGPHYSNIRSLFGNKVLGQRRGWQSVVGVLSRDLTQPLPYHSISPWVRVSFLIKKYPNIRFGPIRTTRLTGGHMPDKSISHEIRFLAPSGVRL